MNKDIYRLENKFYKLISLHHKEMFRKLRAIGLYRGQPFLLKLLNDKNGLSIGDIARKLDKEYATISKMVSRTVKEGLVETKKDKNDNRVSRVYLTKVGREKFIEAEEIKNAVTIKFFGLLTDKDINKMCDLFDCIFDNLKEDK